MSYFAVLLVVLSSFMAVKGLKSALILRSIKRTCVVLLKLAFFLTFCSFALLLH